MRSSPRARAAFLLLYGALLAWQVDRWCFTPHGIVSTWAARHDGRTVSAGTPAGVSQTFDMEADGLDGVWLRPAIAGGAARGELLVDLLQVLGETRQRLLRVAVPATDVSNGVALHVPFRPIRASRGITYQVNVRHVHITGGPAIDLAVTREDVLRSGRLFADGREQWGDLVFETTSRRATLPYWMHEVLRPWPAWVRAWPTVALVLLIFNGILAWACARAVGLVGEPDGSRVLGSPPDSSVAPMVRRLALSTTWLVVVVGVLVALLPSSSTRAIRLVEHVPDARLTSDRPIHEVVAIQPTVFFGRIYESLVVMPPAILEWTIDVPPGAEFVTGAAQRPDLWESQSDGFSMRVEIVHEGRTHEIAHFGLFPLGVPVHRNLHPASVSLQAWANRRVVLRLVVDPGLAGNRVNDVPVWANPMIRWRARADARVIPHDER